MNLYGLIGHPLSHSFSKKYFTEKFEKENITDCSYELFDIDNIEKLVPILNQNSSLKGLNVTIPYKESVIPYLTELSPEAKEIGAVNTIKIEGDKLIGHNTDYFGFKQSLKPFVEINHERALILGTGGASKAVVYALNSININCLFVSRNPKNDNEISYEDVNEYVIKHHQIIVNTTPIGTFPNIEEKPNINYNLITANHLLYDLVYNPKQTVFVKEGKQRGAITLNGYQMLQLQAEKAWQIWNS
ncbi:shikimate dehydrogenase [Vicingus serpentipes]|uniref:Shikimate dehydrogenase n=1 Tax=Vicingus serpentipes TaxID=1926625 RepID=A0A5C6RWA6_9FLAO|nr:shikimate dehydrogenase [Vicingus serpentipes]TXB66608.1 shikimate dehydrogenase [Vicingus serpentipes]